MRHFGMSMEQIEALNDEDFCELAALAYFYEDRQVVATQRGVILAVKEIFGK